MRPEQRIFQLTSYAEGLTEKLGRLEDLTALLLWDNAIGDDDARAIAASLTGLTSLDLAGNGIGDDGAPCDRRVAHRAHLARSVPATAIGADGARAIAASLTGVDLAQSTETTASTMRVPRAIAVCLTGLTSLNLGGQRHRCCMAPERSPRRSPASPRFNLQGNSIGADGARAIAALLIGLTSLNLDGQQHRRLWPPELIAASLTGLTSLDLT